MTTTTVEVLVAPAPSTYDVDDADPYRYGWRYVRCEREDGVVVTEQVPLTLEDVLHPQEGDQVLPPDERGWLWLAPAQIWLGVDQHEIVCYDTTGQPLGNYLALRAALAAEVQAREAAEYRAAAAEARVRELEAELQRLRRSRS